MLLISSKTKIDYNLICFRSAHTYYLKIYYVSVTIVLQQTKQSKTIIGLKH